MNESALSLAALRRTIAALDRGRPAGIGGRFATGHAGLDRALGGGLARGRVHELCCAAGDAGAGAAMALLLARLAGEGVAADAPILWLRGAGAARTCGLPYGPGLAAIGVDPARLLLGMMGDEAMLLQAALDALRCSGLAALVMEAHGAQRRFNLTASRRLALAAEASGVTALLLLVDAPVAASAAESRWRIAAAPSPPLSGQAPGQIPGAAAFDMTLLRRRAGPDGMKWRLGWNRERGVFEEESHERDDLGHGYGEPGHGGYGQGTGGEPTPLSGARLPLPAGRPAADRAA